MLGAIVALAGALARLVKLGAHLSVSLFILAAAMVLGGRGYWEAFWCACGALGTWLAHVCLARRAAAAPTVDKTMQLVEDFLYSTRAKFVETMVAAQDAQTENELRPQTRAFLEQWTDCLRAVFAASVREGGSTIWVAVRAAVRNDDGATNYETQIRRGKYDQARDTPNRSRPIPEDKGVPCHLKQLLKEGRPAIELYGFRDKQDGLKGWDRAWPAQEDERETLALPVFVNQGTERDLDMALIVYVNCREEGRLSPPSSALLARCCCDIVSIYYNVIYDLLDRRDASTAAALGRRRT